MWRHPKYYKELRKRNKLDQAISLRAHDGERERALDPGPKPQAASAKPQAPSLERNNSQASSPKQQASSFKPQASSSMIREPRKSFTHPESRAWTMMKVLCG